MKKIKVKKVKLEVIFLNWFKTIFTVIFLKFSFLIFVHLTILKNQVDLISFENKIH